MIRSKNNLKAWLAAFCIGLFTLGMGACTVEKTEDGNLPEVDMEVKEEGNLPEYDVDAAEVEVGTETKEIEVPDVDIHAPDEDGDG